ncbi:transcriptional regulator, partial [Escherichia coli]|nr:transcriptional regulator [Escherichia coli]
MIAADRLPGVYMALRNKAFHQFRQLFQQHTAR